MPLARVAQSELSLAWLRVKPPSIADISSNLTFGTGGKDKEGKAVAGWGYYEV